MEGEALWCLKFADEISDGQCGGAAVNISNWQEIGCCLLLFPFLCRAQQIEGVVVKEGATVTIPAACPQPQSEVAVTRTGYHPANAIQSDSGRNFQRSDRETNGDIDKIRLSYRPRLYIDFGGSVMPGGYAALAGFGRVGFEVENRSLVADAFAAYDNGHKVNDNDQPNQKGHDRYLHGAVYWRLRELSHPNWFLGVGYRWNQLSTTNYTKGGSRPEFGGGYDLYFDHQRSDRDCAMCWMSARVIVNWVMAGTDWQNGSHGPEFTAIFPRPVEKRRFFLTADLGVYHSHTTVTEPENLGLTRQQLGQHFMIGTYSMGLMYRFW
jgi:hypothetical protein